MFDGSGAEWLVQLVKVTPTQSTGTVLEQRWPDTEPHVALTLCQAVLKADRFEFVLQRCTEAGVARFQPVLSARSIAGMPEGEKLRRWERVIREAAEQSGRVTVPPILPPVRMADMARRADLRPGILLWEGERSTSLWAALDSVVANGATQLSLLVGPEGGFDAPELEPLIAAGFPVAGLGRRILRAETAALAAVVAALYHLGEMG